MVGTLKAGCRVAEKQESRETKGLRCLERISIAVGSEGSNGRFFLGESCSAEDWSTTVTTDVTEVASGGFPEKRKKKLFSFVYSRMSTDVCSHRDCCC